MPQTLQLFLASATQKAMSDLETALQRLPEDKRNWSPTSTARSALDQVAEVAILNGSTCEMIQTRTFPPDFDMAEYTNAKSNLAQDWDALQTLLHQNTAQVIERIRTVSDDELEVEVMMPWGPLTMAQVISYPYWNMTYHEGQINYIASQLGCLE